MELPLFEWKIVFFFAIWEAEMTINTITFKAADVSTNMTYDVC